MKQKRCFLSQPNTQSIGSLNALYTSLLADLFIPTPTQLNNSDNYHGCEDYSTYVYFHRCLCSQSFLQISELRRHGENEIDIELFGTAAKNFEHMLTQ